MSADSPTGASSTGASSSIGVSSIGVSSIGVSSMTGFGRGAAERPGLQVRAEVRSVNARGLKINSRAPASLDAHQHTIDALIRRYVERGTVTVTISVVRAGGAAPARIDAAVLADYAAQLRDAAAAAGIPAETGIDALLRLPGVLGEPAESDLGDDDVAAVTAALGAALDELTAMRRHEGAATQAILAAGADRIETLAARIEERVPAALVEHRQRMRDRLQALLDGTDVPAELVAREAAVLAERTDVAEEIDRLRSHVAQWRDALARGGAVGRRLEFLTQELGREANTIGSKTSDADVRDAVIELKLEVDRLKEQSANIE